MIGKGSLSDQTIGFMQTLTEVVSSVPRCVLIATLPASATEVASSAIGQQILTALEIVLSGLEQVSNPSKMKKYLKSFAVVYSTILGIHK